MTLIPESMTAVRLHSPGGVRDLAYEKTPVPALADGEVLVRVHAAALTRDELGWPADRLPAVPSYELSGTVVAADPTSRFRPGTEVFGLTGFDRDGVAAEFATIRTSELSPKPSTLSHVEAAAVPLPGLSAVQGLFDHGRLERNQRVLIHGGAGGVGAYAVQLARHRGAYVVTTVSTARIAAAHGLGADEVIDHTVTDFTTTGPYDLVFDTVGGDRLLRSVSVLAAGGRLVSVAEPPPSSQCAEAGVEGIFFIVEPNADQLAHLADLADKGALQVMVEETYPLARAVDAFTHLMERGGSGKLVLTVEPPVDLG